MLQANGLSVEVGGRLLVERASFTVMSRDKVGIVGRNGAGKTSLFRVLGGAAEPVAGTVVRKGGFGYLPQDPKIDSALDGRTCVTHVLSGRGIDEELVRIEKLRIAGEQDLETERMENRIALQARQAEADREKIRKRMELESEMTETNIKKAILDAAERIYERLPVEQVKLENLGPNMGLESLITQLALSLKEVGGSLEAGIEDED